MERVLQKRLDYILESRKVYMEEQDGFRRGRSTTDSLMKIHNFITSTLKNKETCVIVYLDLEGAYDGVWHQGLIHKLIQLGVGKTYVRWIRSYLKERTGKVMLGTDESDLTQIKCGLPQGAVLSPMLFNLMLQDMPTQETIHLAIYADDITVMSRGRDPTIVRQNMQTYLDSLLEWMKRWKFRVNAAKCSQQIFTNKRTVPDIILRINRSILRNVREQRVLGIIFDSPKLTFSAHIEHLRVECRKRINILKIISSKRWGANRNLLRRVYISFIRSKMEYGSVVFGNSSARNLKKLEVLQNQALRCILGARKTTPIASLEVESFIPPIELRFKFLVVKWYYKLKGRYRDDSTSKILGLNNSNIHSVFKSQAEHMCNKLGMISLNIAQTPTTPTFPPWLEHNIAVNLDIPNRHTSLTGNMEILVREHIETEYPNCIELYTDGSKHDDGSATAALYVPNLDIAVGWRMNPRHTILGAELFGIFKALEFANTHIELRDKNILILTDSLSSLHLINNTTNPPYRHIVSTIQTLISESMNERQVFLQWVKSHMGVKGNEIVDQVANRSHLNDKSVLTKLEYEEVQLELKQKFERVWTEEWKRRVEVCNAGKFYSELVNVPKLNLWKRYESRTLECVMSRLRMGHVGVAEHLNRFNMRESGMCVVCRVREDVKHLILECMRYRQERQLMYQQLHQIGVLPSLKNILGCGNNSEKKEKKIQKALANFLTATGRVDEI